MSDKYTAELDLIKKLLAANPDLEPKMAIDAIVLETRFREDLGFDSLAIVSLFYELQETYTHLEEIEVTRWNKILDCIQSLKTS
jgi:acyl carrier protein